MYIVLTSLVPWQCGTLSSRLLQRLYLTYFLVLCLIYFLKRKKGFIRGRNIKIVSAFNIMDKKCFGGSIALKVDVNKAFETLNWRFLLKVLEMFGFGTTFCNWIHSILYSTYKSVIINGVSHSYFKCDRCVRK